MTKKQSKDLVEAVEGIVSTNEKMLDTLCKASIIIKAYAAIAMEAQSDINTALKHIPPTSTARRHLLSAMTKLSKIV